MRFFYQEKNDLLLVAPFVNGSSFLYRNKEHLGLVQFNININLTLNSITNNHLVNDDELLEKIKTIKNKIFIYRNPIERVYSYYQRFLYSPYIRKTSFLTNVPDRLLNGSDYIKYLYMNFDYIKKLYYSDSHLLPQIKFFDYYNQNTDDYNIINFWTYRKLLLKYFDSELTANETNDKLGYLTSAVDIKHTPVDMYYINKINNMLENMYKEDLEILEPIATFL